MTASKLAHPHFPFGLMALLVSAGTVLTFLVVSNSLALWNVVIVCAVAGCILGPRLSRWFHRDDETSTEDSLDVRINGASIPIRGGVGAGLIIGFLFLLTLIDLPPLRWFALPGIGVGLVFGAVLVWWRNHHSD